MKTSWRSSCARDASPPTGTATRHPGGDRHADPIRAPGRDDEHGSGLRRRRHAPRGPAALAAQDADPLESRAAHDGDERHGHGGGASAPAHRPRDHRPASLQDTVAMGYHVAEVRHKHRGGDYQVDEFGFDRTWTEALIPLFRILYRRYWRVETSGIEVVPSHGPALLVSNHSGVLPLDGAMLRVAGFDDTAALPPPLVAPWFGRP